MKSKNAKMLQAKCRVDTIYMYERIQKILDMDDLADGLSRLHDDLARNFYTYTGRKIGEARKRDAKFFVETTDWFLAGMSYDNYYDEYPHEKIHGKIK